MFYKKRDYFSIKERLKWLIIYYKKVYARLSFYKNKIVKIGVYKIKSVLYHV